MYMSIKTLQDLIIDKIVDFTSHHIILVLHTYRFHDYYFSSVNNGFLGVTIWNVTLVCRQYLYNACNYLSNRFFFFERDSLINATVCAYKWKPLQSWDYPVHVPLLNKKNPLLIFTFLKPFLQQMFNFFNHYQSLNSYIPTSKVIRSCSYRYISLQTSNVFLSSISNEM